MSDTVSPICSSAQLQSGAFADLTRSFSVQALDDICVEATRWCETEVGRRLAPFTGMTEIHRAEGIDPDELSAVNSGVPMDIYGALGTSYAQAIGYSGDLVRHVWLNEHAPHYAEKWLYANVQITVVRSIGGTQQIAVLDGPDPATGHVWFRLGSFIPVGSLLRATYDGGYSAYPADLVRAAKYAAAAICVHELDPIAAAGHGHDAGSLEELASSALAPYARGD